MGLDPVRAVVTALRPRPDIARPPPPIHPFDRRRGRNPEAARRRAPRQAAVNRRYKPFSKIIGKRFRHAGWPPPPAHILNQKFDPMGIPKRIRQLRKCSSFVKVLALGASGYQPSFKEMCEILGVTFANSFMTRDGGWTSEFFEQRNGRQVVKSSIFAQYLLRNFVSDRDIMDHLVELVEDLDRKEEGNPLLRKMRTFPLRFSFIERLLDDDGKRSKLVEYYETVRSRGIGTRNPQFWLQYAIARMSFKDYQNAGVYFETAFSLSERMSNYDDYQIRNHYARYLLESSIEKAVNVDPVEVFRQAHDILVDQIEGKSEGHYPYRVAQKYLDFIEAKEDAFDNEAIAEFDSACEQVLGFIGNLSQEMRRDRYVRRCKERLKEARDFVADLL